jgi:hypothetical protein
MIVKYGDTLFALNAWDSRAGADAREFKLRYFGPHYPEANVFRRLQHRLRET